MRDIAWWHLARYDSTPWLFNILDGVSTILNVLARRGDTQLSRRRLGERKEGREEAGKGQAGTLQSFDSRVTVSVQLQR